jgi:hypothetical protein
MVSLKESAASGPRHRVSAGEERAVAADLEPGDREGVGRLGAGQEVDRVE